MRFFVLFILLSATVGLGLLPQASLAQQRFIAGAATASDVALQAAWLDLELLESELVSLEARVSALSTLRNQINTCSTAGKVYAWGHRSADTNGCVAVGQKVVREVAVITEADGDRSGDGGTTMEARLLNFANANGCPTSGGWHICSDYELAYWSTIRDLSYLDNSYAVRSLNPWAGNSGSSFFANWTGPTSFDCNEWTSNAVSATRALMTYTNGVPRLAACDNKHDWLCCR